MTIFYLHGFASAGNGRKASALRQRFGPRNVLAPDLPVDPDEVRALLDRLVGECAQSDVILVGTSLGGFYAWYMSQRWDGACVLANPRTRPSKTLGRKPGVYRNHVTDAELVVSCAFGQVWGAMEQEAWAKQQGARISLFLAQDDDVLAYQHADTDIQECSRRVILPDGGHRFEKHWDLVMNEVARLKSDGAC
jgi:uncharacterized protein